MKKVPGAGKRTVSGRKSRNAEWRDRPVSVDATLEERKS